MLVTKTRIVPIFDVQNNFITYKEKTSDGKVYTFNARILLNPFAAYKFTSFQLVLKIFSTSNRYNLDVLNKVKQQTTPNNLVKDLETYDTRVRNHAKLELNSLVFQTTNDIRSYMSENFRKYMILGKIDDAISELRSEYEVFSVLDSTSKIAFDKKLDFEGKINNNPGKIAGSSDLFPLLSSTTRNFNEEREEQIKSNFILEGNPIFVDPNFQIKKSSEILGITQDDIYIPIDIEFTLPVEKVEYLKSLSSVRVDVDSYSVEKQNTFQTKSVSSVFAIGDIYDLELPFISVAQNQKIGRNLISVITQSIDTKSIKLYYRVIIEDKNFEEEDFEYLATIENVIVGKEFLLEHPVDNRCIIVYRAVPVTDNKKIVPRYSEYLYLGDYRSKKVLDDTYKACVFRTENKKEGIWIEVSNIPETVAVVTILKKIGGIEDYFPYSKLKNSRKVLKGRDRHVTFIDTNVHDGELYSYSYELQMEDGSVFSEQDVSVRTRFVPYQGDNPVKLVNNNFNFDTKEFSFDLKVDINQQTREGLIQEFSRAFGITDIFTRDIQGESGVSADYARLLTSLTTSGVNASLSPTSIATPKTSGYNIADFLVYVIEKVNIFTGESEWFRPIPVGTRFEESKFAFFTNIRPTQDNQLYKYIVYIYIRNPASVIGTFFPEYRRERPTSFINFRKFRNSYTKRTGIFFADDDRDLSTNTAQDEATLGESLATIEIMLDTHRKSTGVSSIQNFHIMSSTDNRKNILNFDVTGSANNIDSVEIYAIELKSEFLLEKLHPLANNGQSYTYIDDKNKRIGDNILIPTRYRIVLRGKDFTILDSKISSVDFVPGDLDSRRAS